MYIQTFLCGVASVLIVETIALKIAIAVMKRRGKLWKT